MMSHRHALAVVWLALLAAAGCGKQEPASSAGSGGGAAKEAAVKEAPRKAVVETVPPYTYAAPVKGHVHEANLGQVDLVDGIAYPSPAVGGTVVFVTSKPIASPMLVDSACPFVQARALAALRDASFAEVTLDAGARSKYFAAGGAYGNRFTDLTAGAWASALATDAGRAKGNVNHARYGQFEFDLPLSHPAQDELTYGDRQNKRALAASTPKPEPQAVTATYTALRDAALRKDLKATLAALGFDAKQVAAIRGMEGIDADFAVFADRFLTPGTPGDPWTRAGSGQVRGEGVKASGKKYFNDYYFDLCGERLVLTGIVEQSP
jgi:hypothetical protein